jgi:2-methylcitrate dehydratase PrpD
VGLLKRPITAQDRQRAALHLLDWLGCALLGAQSPVGDKLRGLADSSISGVVSDAPCTTLMAAPGSWQSALWVNAAVGNVEEMDDVHRTSVLHPGPVVIPTALACVQQQGASVSALLDAIVIGYEATIRIGRALGPDHYRYYHNTSSCGSFGAAAAVGAVLALTEEQLVSALGNAGSRTGGLWQMRNESVDTKQFHNVDAALSGSLAAYMAAADISGPAEILEGPQGLFSATSPLACPERVVNKSDAPWLIWECSFKPWPACRHVHATIDACRKLPLAGIDVSIVKSIQVQTYNDALVFCDRPDPQTRLQAKFSLQHAVAVCLLEGTPRLTHFEADCYESHPIAALRETVKVSQSDAYQQAYPEHFGAAIEVTLEDGRQLSASVTDAWGDPENPLSDSQIADKARQLMKAAGILNTEALINETLALGESNQQDTHKALLNWSSLLQDCCSDRVGAGHD